MSDWVESPADLRDFLSYVILYAPDSFPSEDYLPPNEQMTLPRAFGELEQGVRMMYGALPEGVLPERLERLVSEARAAFEGGSETKGAHLLQELEGLLFGNQTA